MSASTDANELIATLNSFFEYIDYGSLTRDELAQLSILTALPATKEAIFEYWLGMVQQRLHLDTLLAKPSSTKLETLAPDGYELPDDFRLTARLERTHIFMLSPRELARRKRLGSK